MRYCNSYMHTILAESALSRSEGPDHLDGITNANVSIVQVHESGKRCYGNTIEESMTDLLQNFRHIVFND